jgi:hypothetical protein
MVVVHAKLACTKLLGSGVKGLVVMGETKLVQGGWCK